MTAVPWKVSLHGGHSVDYCDHAHSTLREMLDAAVEKGFRIFGITEHAPRTEDRFLFPEERAMGWDVATLDRLFRAYAEDTRALVDEYAGRLTVLRGFESEVVPADAYVALVKGWREEFGFDYIVGSVHHLYEQTFDSSQQLFDDMVADHGGLEPVAMEYYRSLAAMVEALRPEVVGHFDLIRIFAGPHGPVDTPPIREAAEAALEAVQRAGSILDLNAVGLLKGQGMPYPAPWVVQRAAAMGIPFCFGDDSHSAEAVGTHFDEARAYLLENGVTAIRALTRGEHGIEPLDIPL